MKKILAIAMIILVSATSLVGCTKAENKSSATYIGKSITTEYKLAVQESSKNDKLLSYGVADHLKPGEIRDRLIKDISLGKMNISSISIIYQNDPGVFSNYCKGDILNVRIQYRDGKEPGIGNNLRVKVVGLAEFFAKDENRINTDAVGVEIFDYLVLYDNYIDTVYVFYFK